MTEEQHDLIIRLREKISSLITLYEKEQKTVKNLEAENSELKNKLSVRESEFDILNKKFDTLKLAKVISGKNGESHD